MLAVELEATNSEGYNLFDCLGSTVEVDDSLVDPQLKSIPRLRALAARSLATRDAESFSGHSDWTLHTEIRLLRSLDEVTADWGREKGGERGGKRRREEREGGKDKRGLLSIENRGRCEPPFSKLFTFLLVRVILILWMVGSSCSPSFLLYDCRPIRENHNHYMPPTMRCLQT